MNNKYIQNNHITNEYVESYIKSKYRILGKHKHTALKPCHWLEQKLLTGRNNRNCYKGVFGVESHRCLQNSPSLPFCTHQCVFCWRDVESGTLGSEFKVTPDEPQELVEEMISHQRDIIQNHLPLRRYLDNYEIILDILYFMLVSNGTYNVDKISQYIHISKNKIERALNLLKNQDFIKPIDQGTYNYILDEEIKNSIDSKEEIELLVNRALTTPNEIMKAHNEALYPNHAAISLDGEPMLYPHISGLVTEFRKRDMTTFIVTNGTLPDHIENLTSLPSQLYVTLPASNEKLYKKITRPMVKNGWQKLNKSLSLLDSLETRTLIRLTAIRNVNIKDTILDEYIKIIEDANPNFFEIKGFTLQAKALSISNRLKENHPVQYYFPDYDYLENIAELFEQKSGFPIIYRNEASRDFLFAVNWDKNKDPIITKP